MDVRAKGRELPLRTEPFEYEARRRLYRDGNQLLVARATRQAEQQNSTYD
jgi:hypothetical protein